MRVELFDYHLPPELIAQTPLEPRDSSRLMVVERTSGKISHHRFRELVDMLNQADVMILNRTRVRKARLFGVKIGTGARVELLLLRPLDKFRERWEALARPARRLKAGTQLEVGEGELHIEVVEDKGEGLFVLRLFSPRHEEIEELIERYGKIPLPPYIKKELKDQERYQTVFASETGSVAATTAALHFTPDMLDRIRRKGVEVGYIYLQIGLDTFRPVQEEEVERHSMHSEEMEVGEEVCDLVHRVRGRKGRVVAVGTTVTRALETAVNPMGMIRPFKGSTRLFIYPGYKFQVVDALITNFHLPRSTLLMLVCAFAGRDLIFTAYEEAIKERYRFYSFGDAMLIY